MTKYPRISVIIPLYVIEERFFRDLLRFQNQSYKNFEILVICDKRVNLPKLKNIELRFIQTNRKNTGPAEKRDFALSKVNGEICAFIDDDAYPDPKWIRNAVKILDDPQIAAVGGPGVTPQEDEYWEQLTGKVYESILCGGFFRHRFMPLERKKVTDFPAYNLFVRTKVLKQVGGYGNNFYGGEDTFLCLKLINAGFSIIYDPSVVVYHHRRALYLPYLKQIANVGKHRGYFARVFPQTSRKFEYFLPSVASLGFFILLGLSVFNKNIFILFLSLTLLSIVFGFISVIKFSNFIDAIFISLGILSSHLAYGLSFIKGLFTPKLER